LAIQTTQTDIKALKVNYKTEWHRYWSPRVQSIKYSLPKHLIEPRREL